MDEETLALQETLDMADMYAAVCERDERNFLYWREYVGCPWTWIQCIEAFSALQRRPHDRFELWNNSTRRSLMRSHPSIVGDKKAIYRELTIALAGLYHWEVD